MKRMTLEATDNNIYDSIKNNNYGRNQDILEFVNALDTIEGNMFISLDGKWGAGKTFYVRQIEKTLEYATRKKFDEESDEQLGELAECFNGGILENVKLNNAYLPIYYNAWQYDNHTEPLLSLVLTIAKKVNIDAKDKKSFGRRLSEIVSSVSVGKLFAGIDISMNSETFKGAFHNNDILEEVKSVEEIRELISIFLKECVVGTTQKLVIFIDELDRCRPNYAIEMLERIKHYFNEEHIIFIVSVNKAQLVHTISKYYGYGFNSSGYLNKFFDLSVHLPVEEIESKKNIARMVNTEQMLYVCIVNELNDYFQLSLRDSLIYKQKIMSIPMEMINISSSDGICLSFFIPIIVMLDIISQDEKRKFVNGLSSILEEVCRNIPAIKKTLFGYENGKEGVFTQFIEQLVATYKYVFGSPSLNAYYRGNESIMNVSRDLKKRCIKVCNDFRDK